MSRVMSSTLRPALTVAALLPLCMLHACGDDETAKSGSSPSAASPAAAPLDSSDKQQMREMRALDREARKEQRRAAKANDPEHPLSFRAVPEIPPVFSSEVAVTKEGRVAIRQASVKVFSNRQTQARMDAIVAALKKAELQPRRPAASVVVHAATSTTVLVYRSERQAAVLAAGYIRSLEDNRGDGRLARRGTVVVFTRPQKGMTAALREEEFKLVRQTAFRATR